MRLLFEDNALELQEIVHPLFTEKKVRVTIARLDKIHKDVSGNKLFKLHFFLQEAMSANKAILTFGGAYSNHLAATAYAAAELGLKAIGIVRGEEPGTFSHTLQYCRSQDMELHFISRENYKQGILPSGLPDDYLLIPEGGYHPLGAKGAALIMQRIESLDASHICVAVGTATTLAGLIAGAKKEQQIIGFPVLKNMTDIQERLCWLLGQGGFENLQTDGNYHFGGYAKFTKELLSFMNDFYSDHQVPLDFVYTAKMLFGTIDKIKKDHFAEQSHIVCLHTGGLQGNASLQKGILVY